MRKYWLQKLFSSECEWYLVHLKKQDKVIFDWVYQETEFIDFPQIFLQTFRFSFDSLLHMFKLPRWFLSS